jgi:hypothetical protein
MTQSGQYCADIIACGHARLVEGALGAEFLAAFKALMEWPLTMMI